MTQGQRVNKDSLERRREKFVKRPISRPVFVAPSTPCSNTASTHIDSTLRTNLHLWMHPRKLRKSLLFAIEHATDKVPDLAQCRGICRCDRLSSAFPLPQRCFFRSFARSLVVPGWFSSLLSTPFFFLMFDITCFSYTEVFFPNVNVYRNDRDNQEARGRHAFSVLTFASVSAFGNFLWNQCSQQPWILVCHSR